MLGRRIGSWILERELGRGGMGAVFEARHGTLHTKAAVKVLSAGLESQESFRQRFRREAELQAQLRHSNVARVLDYLEADGQWFLVLEYLDRGSLADRLSRGERVSRQQAVAWIRQALAGLGHAHEKGIVHRDIKPANLMFSASGEIVVVDFGIARADTAPGLTASGVTIGTPHYMSPEQIVTPNRVDGRADIYSLGIVLYELLAGQRPFNADSDFAVLQAQVTQPPPPLRVLDPSIPPQLEAVVMRALAKQPEDRHPDCASMILTLDGIDTGVPVEPTAPITAAPGGGTVMQSSFYERATMPHAATPAPGVVRAQNRRSFRRRVFAGTLAVLFMAILLAVRQSDSKAEPVIPIPGTDRTDTTDTTDTTSTTDRTDTTVSTFPPPDTRKKIKPTPVPEPKPQPEPQPPPVVPPPVPALPEHPQIAVIGTGSDPMLAGALEQEFERRLGDRRVVDEHGLPEIDELLARKDVTPKALGAELLKGGFHILVLVRVENGEQRELTIRGQSLHAKTARTRLNAYLLPANRMIGPGWTELVEYTELSASAKARQAFIGPTADLRQAIDQDWAGLRGGRP